MRSFTPSWKYLFYMAVICVVPALSDSVSDIGSVVSTHHTTRVHHNCIQSVPAVTLEEQNMPVNDRGCNVQIINRNQQYLDKVRRECFADSLGKVKGFWKGNRAVKFSGTNANISKPFQVCAQNVRQGEQFETL